MRRGTRDPATATVGQRVHARLATVGGVAVAVAPSRMAGSNGAIAQAARRGGVRQDTRAPALERVTTASAGIGGGTRAAVDRGTAPIGQDTAGRPKLHTGLRCADPLSAPVQSAASASLSGGTRTAFKQASTPIWNRPAGCVEVCAARPHTSAPIRAVESTNERKRTTATIQCLRATVGHVSALRAEHHARPRSTRRRAAPVRARTAAGHRIAASSTFDNAPTPVGS